MHAWELYGEEAMRHSALMHVPDEEVEVLLDEERASHERALHDMVQACDVAAEPWDIHLIKGPPATVVPALVAKRRINLLVLGTVARTGVNRMIMGNTAERLLDEVTCSVIALKPEGFVSPIEAPAS